VSSRLSPEEYAYDAVSGVSGGSMNSVILSDYEKGQEKAAAQRMEKFWVDAANNKLYKNWILGKAQGLFNKGGIYNAQPLWSFLSKELGSVKPKRQMDMGIVDIVSGKYKEFSSQNITYGASLNDALDASLSYPGFFPPANVFDSYYFDATTVWDIDIATPINRCKDKGFTNENIVVDVILTSSADLKEIDASNYKSVQMLFRYLEISSFYQSMDGLLRAKFAFPGVNFRYVVSPTVAIPSSNKPMSMSENDVKLAIAAGVKDAQDAINGKYTVEDLIHYYSLKKFGNGVLKGRSYGSFVEAKRNGEFDWEKDVMQQP